MNSRHPSSGARETGGPGRLRCSKKPGAPGAPGEPDEFQNRWLLPSVSIWSFIMGPILMLTATFSVDLERRFAMLQIDTEGSSQSQNSNSNSSSKGNLVVVI